MDEDGVKREAERMLALSSFSQWQLGWGVVEEKCPMCNVDTVYVLPMGATVEADCPRCGFSSVYALLDHGDGVWIRSDPE